MIRDLDIRDKETIASYLGLKRIIKKSPQSHVLIYKSPLAQTVSCLLNG